MHYFPQFKWQVGIINIFQKCCFFFVIIAPVAQSEFQWINLSKILYKRKNIDYDYLIGINAAL